MIYYQTEKGYCYKKYKNGTCKRISETEYQKNNQSGGRQYKCMKKSATIPSGNDIQFVESRFDPRILNEKFRNGWICTETNLRNRTNKNPGCHLGAVEGMDCVPCSVKPSPKACRPCISSNKNAPEVFYCKKKAPYTRK